jgi:transcriptional regulator with XRE-family HTH domain
MNLTYERLSALRRAAGLSQEQLALLIEVDRSNLSRMERGRRGIDIQTAERWVNACKARIAILTPEHDDLVKIVGNLGPDELSIVRRLASVLPVLHPVRRADLVIQLDAWERSSRLSAEINRGKTAG